MIEGAAKKYEREHNARVWLAWHIAALHRMQRLPDIERMYLNNTSSPRQSWREQLTIMTEWAAQNNAYVEMRKKMKEK